MIQTVYHDDGYQADRTSILVDNSKEADDLNTMNIVGKSGVDNPVLGEREVEIMRVLWVAGSGTVSEVRSKLAAELAYTTVLTILRNLEAKGYVAHEEEGRVHRYSPLLGRREATQAAISRVVDAFFEGSPEQLVRHLAHTGMVGRKSLKRIRRELAKGQLEPLPAGPNAFRTKKGRPQGTQGSEAAARAVSPGRS